MSLPTPPEFRALSCWPSIVCVSVAAAWKYEPPPVLLIQVDHKMRRLEHFTLPFHQALSTVKP
jgi:hypothetical protein